MVKTNNIVFTGLQIVSWLIFVGLCIEAGGLLVNFIFSIYKPEFIDRLYQKLDLRAMYNQSKYSFIGMYSFILFISFSKAYLFYLVVMLVTKLDLSKPFNRFVSSQITKISYITFEIGLISFIAREAAKNLQHRGFDTEILNEFWADSQAFILMAAIIYLIATIFTKGIEIQEENDLIL